MYKPDHIIVRRIKQYDPHLYVKYNQQNQYFEVWREMPWGHRLITPVVPDIYGIKARKRFMQLDDRILWWLAEADSQRQDKFTLEKRDIKHNSLTDRRRTQAIREFKDVAKDMYSLGEAFFAKKHAPKNDVNKQINKAFKKKAQNSWIKPDSRSNISHRLFSRSSQNARAYNYKDKR